MVDLEPIMTEPAVVKVKVPKERRYKVKRKRASNVPRGDQRAMNMRRR
ncbi:MAG: hypothetical protein LLG16_07155 [Euryarchaeota archaeon]|nr:hypothetical protein [Euryarchaeota archaeon]